MSAPVVVAVAPTDTIVASYNGYSAPPGLPTVVGLQVTNLDGAQTFTGTLYSRLAGESVTAPSTLPDFGAVGPGASVVAIIDCTALDYLELHGHASGAGLNVRVTWR